MEAERAVLLYDADCGVCTRSVAWVRKRDPHGRVRCVAAASGEGQAMLRDAGLLGVEARTVVLLPRLGRRNRASLRSAAATRTLWHMGGRWKAAATLLWLVPWPLRELGYRWFAANRHRFGAVCAVPAEAGRAAGPPERER